MVKQFRMIETTSPIRSILRDASRILFPQIFMRDSLSSRCPLVLCGHRDDARSGYSPAGRWFRCGV